MRAETFSTLRQRVQPISEQVSREQIQTILTELERVLETQTTGAVVEFGCYIGTTSLYIERLLSLHHDERPFHVYDSFAGLPAKTNPDASPAGEQFQAGELSVTKKQFIHEFQKAKLRLPTIHKSWFSELTDHDLPESIAFAFLDGDFYESIRDSLVLVLPRMTAGSTLVIDDYAREALPGVAKAVAAVVPRALRDTIRTVHNQAVIRLPGRE